MTARLVDDVHVVPARARVYAEGWQSWSPTTWYGAGEVSHRPDTAWQHAMRFRPGIRLPGRDVPGAQGEGLLVVEPGTGAPARVYATEEASDRVASIRTALRGDRLLVTADDDVTTTEAADGPEAGLAAFGDRFAARAGVRRIAPAPRVWCSWYRYFLDVTQQDVLENLSAIGRHELPVDVVQIDDGWCVVGEWDRPTEAFPSLPGLVDTIRSAGRRAGIWLAPFLVGVRSELAERHPDWLVGYAGHNWDQDLVGLDLSHPGVQDHLRTSVTTLRAMGVDYFKLDFLYAGAVPGRRWEDVSTVTAYRDGLHVIREAAGEDSYLVGCGAPILPSVGLVDAMRVSPDTFHVDDQDGTRGLRGRMSATARAWQHGRFWVNDADCFVGRESYALRAEWAEVIADVGGLRSCSDRIDELDAWGLETTRRLLADVPPPTPFEASSPMEG